jgi:hypothetical protein
MKRIIIAKAIIFQKIWRRYLNVHWKHVRFVQTSPEQQHNKSMKIIIATQKMTSKEKNKA